MILLAITAFLYLQVGIGAYFYMHEAIRADKSIGPVRKSAMVVSIIFFWLTLLIMLLLDQSDKKMDRKTQ